MPQIAPHAFFTAIWNGDRYEIEGEGIEPYHDDFLDCYLQLYDLRKEILGDAEGILKDPNV
jgi:hypothetical protein